MAKDNYKNEFEQSRQEINITDGADGRKVLSRVDLHANAKPSKRSRFSLINILLVIFTFIPIGILTFVLFSLLFNKEPITPKVEDPSVQLELSKKPSGSAGVTDDEKKKDDEKSNNQKEKEAQKKEEEKKKEAEQQKADKAKKKEEEQKRKEEEEQKQAEEQRKKEEEQKRAEEERKKEEQQVPAGSHVVQPGETLYRVSVIHYGNGDGVDKIRSANGISGNAISAGQTLVIPK